MNSIAQGGCEYQRTAREREMSDIVLNWMRENNIELTARNYISLAYMGDVPDEFTDEDKAALLTIALARCGRKRKSRKSSPAV